MRNSQNLRLVGIFFFAVGVCAACDYVQEMWHTPFAANIQEHHSPTPPHNVMVVEENATISGEIHDTFAQEDQSTLDGSAGNDRVYSDRPLEEYLGSMVGSDDPKYMTYQTRATKPFQANLRPLTHQDVFGGQDGHGFYSIKLTNGMVYKTDQLKCDTPFEHPTTHYEREGSDDHTAIVNDAGEYELSSSDDYCFYLYQPSNGNLPAMVSRVNEEDENSLGQIKEGIVPYLRLEDDLKTKLSSADGGDFTWVKGRYILPMPEGKMAVPKNGTNLAHNRVTVYRPYHQDVKRQSAGSTASAKLLATLSNSFPAARTEAGEAAPEFFPIDGLSSRAAGIEYEDPIHARGDEPRYGSKLSSWGANVGKQYLALGPEDSNPKRVNWALHFPSAEAEREYLDRAASGNLDVNSNRVAGDSRFGEKALASSEVSEKLNPAVLFQLGAQGVYTPGGSGGNYDPNQLTSQDETVSCDDPRIKPWCDKYRPFHTELVELYAEMGVAGVAGADEEFERILQSAPLDRAITVGGKTFFISTPRMEIGEFENRNKAFFDDLDVTIPGSDAERHDYNWILFMTREPTIGMDMDRRLVKLKAGMASDYERLALRNFPGEDEEDYFDGQGAQILAGCAGAEVCAENGFKTLVDTRYIPIEKNKIVSGAFLYYTSQVHSGRRLLSRLALLQHWMSYPGNDIPWRNLLPQELQNCTKGNMLPCVRNLDGSTQPPVRPNDDYKFLRYDPDKEPFIKLGT